MNLKLYTYGFYGALVLFTTLVLLLEFVIPHGGVVVEDVEVVIEIPIIEDETTGEVIGLTYTDELPQILEDATIIGTYQTETVIISVYHIRMYDSDVYVADVVSIDAKTILNAFAYDTFGGKNITQAVSVMAESNDAVFAMNADYASHYDEGIVIRNGQILRSSISYRDAVVLYNDGTIHTFTEEDTTAQELLDDDAWQVWSFGPVLIDDGVIVADKDGGLDRSRVDNPRSSFGMVSTNHFMFVSVDGRSTVSQGVDIEELADILLQLGCVEAYNLDGGGSATMWFDGEVINVPSEGSERKVGDCVYIAY